MTLVVSSLSDGTEKTEYRWVEGPWGGGRKGKLGLPALVSGPPRLGESKRELVAEGVKESVKGSPNITTIFVLCSHDEISFPLRGDSQVGKTKCVWEISFRLRESYFLCTSQDTWSPSQFSVIVKTSLSTSLSKRWLTGLRRGVGRDWVSSLVLSSFSSVTPSRSPSSPVLPYKEHQFQTEKDPSLDRVRSCRKHLE